jgi:hypothetical protein
MPSDEAMDNSQGLDDANSMAKRPIDIESVKRKKFKTDDLPLSAAQHAVIDKLLHSFKKKGGFDSVRKQIWADFNEGVWDIIHMLFCALLIILNRNFEAISPTSWSHLQSQRSIASQHCCPVKEEKQRRSLRAQWTVVMSTRAWRTLSTN